MNAWASALEWWREAGVDVIVGETPHNWLAPAPPQTGRAAEPRPALPDTLDVFQTWLLENPDLPPAAPRVGPSGDPAAGLMVMIDMPAPEDVERGTLLAGEAGALFDRMMAAIGRGRDSLYLAALSPVPTAMGRIPRDVLGPLAEIARHHVGLVKPRALLLFGEACSAALIGAPVAAARAKWHEIATSAGPVRTLATMKPHKLLQQPALKKLAWEDLQMLAEALEG